jgi:hypothetical protein
MKKIKRALAMIMVATLVLGMCSMAAFADGDPDSAQENPSEVSPVASDGGQAVTNSVSRKSTVEDPITTLPVTKVVEASKGVALPNTEFYLQMVPATGEDLKVQAAGTVLSDTESTSKISPEKGKDLSNPILTFTFDQDNKVGKNGKVSMTKDFELTFKDAFDHSGIYRYVVSEVTKKVAEDKTETYEKVQAQNDDAMHYISYDTTEYLVDLYVDQNSNKDFVVYATSVTKRDSDKKPTDITFTNKIECGTITITKEVDGTEYTKDEAFQFYIMIPEKGDSIVLEKSDKIYGQVYNADGTKDGELIELQTRGENIGADVTVGTPFKLKNGQSLEITAPLSMIFKVGELDYSQEGYTTEIGYEESGSYKKSETRDLDDKSNYSKPTYSITTTDGETLTGTATCVYGTTNTKGTDVLFTNTRKISPATGINLDFVPYVIVLALVIVAGGAVLVYKKKRTVR